MKVIIDCAVMVCGVVVIDTENGEGGSVTIIKDTDVPFVVSHVANPADVSAQDAANQLVRDDDLKNVAILRLIGKAHERWQAKLEGITVVERAPVGEAN